MSAVAATGGLRAMDSEWLTALLDRAFIMGSVILIPFDLPLVHQACVPLAALAVVLIAVRGDFSAFVGFLRGLALPVVISLQIYAIALLSVFANMPSILEAAFQGETGWSRALLQGALLLVTVVYPFYLAFCLHRHGNWKDLIIQSAWWSLPIPLLVGFLQIGNLFHVPGLAHLPYVGDYEGGFWRLTTVARESSWFGSFSCVILPFLMMGLSRLSGWRRWGGIALIGIVLFFIVLGTSKSAYTALAAEATIAVAIYFVAWRPWRALGKVLFVLGLFLAATLLLWALVPSLFEMMAAPFIRKAVDLYNIFEPLLLGNTRFLSIGTRFGMSAAGITMGQDHPVLGIGLGQFGFHAYNYTPLWGMNAETVGWLSNDTHSWPSTSNLYTRLVGEIGMFGCFAYVALRLAIMVPVGLRLLRRSDPAWMRNLCIFSTLVALIVFDLHRDSFINLDIWVAMAMALACCYESVSHRVSSVVAPPRSLKRVFFAASAGALSLGMGLLLFSPQSYLASATVIETTGKAFISPGDASASRGPTGVASTMSEGHFSLLRVYWGSTNVAARIIAHRPDLARAVLGDGPVSAVTLSRYIQDNVAVLMADKQSTLTFQYRNPDPHLAQDFLAEAIDQTDHAIADGVAVIGQQAQQVLQMTLTSNADLQTRQSILSQVAAEDLESSFDVTGGHPSFTYVEHAGILRDMQSPRPLVSVLFAFGLAVLTGAFAVMGLLLLPARRDPMGAV